MKSLTLILVALFLLTATPADARRRRRRRSRPKPKPVTAMDIVRIRKLSVPELLKNLMRKPRPRLKWDNGWQEFSSPFGIKHRRGYRKGHKLGLRIEKCSEQQRLMFHLLVLKSTLGQVKDYTMGGWKKNNWIYFVPIVDRFYIPNVGRFMPGQPPDHIKYRYIQSMTLDTCLEKLNSDWTKVQLNVWYDYTEPIRRDRKVRQTFYYRSRCGGFSIKIANAKIGTDKKAQWWMLKRVLACSGVHHSPSGNYGWISIGQQTRPFHIPGIGRFAPSKKQKRRSRP